MCEAEGICTFGRARLFLLQRLHDGAHAAPLARIERAEAQNQVHFLIVEVERLGALDGTANVRAADDIVDGCIKEVRQFGKYKYVRLDVVVFVFIDRGLAHLNGIRQPLLADSVLLP